MMVEILFLFSIGSSGIENLLEENCLSFDMFF